MTTLASTGAPPWPAVVRPGLVDYRDAWDEQRRLHAAVADGTGVDTVLLLEHPSVYTAGRRTELEDRPVDGTPVQEVDRGGKITWHGPGQLVGYPILRLADPIDVVAYVRRIEQVLIDACAELGLPTTRIPDRSGVWVPADERGPARKVAAIGVRVARGVTLHGFALNCDCDLTAFDRIVACGIRDAGVTSLTAELSTEPSAEVPAEPSTMLAAAEPSTMLPARRVTVADALAAVERHLPGLAERR